MSATALDVFETHRSKLVGVAYRITGSAFEGEDIVHETFIKWFDADHKTIQSPYSWLVTVTTRLSLDYLKSAKVKRQSYIGPWLPEPLVADKETPENELELDESITMALLLLLDTLSPAERASFILHDLFHFDFEEIGLILDKAGATCRKLASRARTKIKQDKIRPCTDKNEHQAVVSAFFDAVKNENMSNLVMLLKDDVVFHADGGGKVEAAIKILNGTNTVSEFLFEKVSESFADKQSEINQIWFNGSPGLVITTDGILVSAFNFEIENHKITKIHALRNPDKLEIFKNHLN